jgi:hypothetical protein
LGPKSWAVLPPAGLNSVKVRLSIQIQQLLNFLTARPNVIGFVFAVRPNIILGLV